LRRYSNVIVVAAGPLDDRHSTCRGSLGRHVWAGIYIHSAERHPAEMILSDGAVGSGDAQEAGDS
jgi:hypothetical protein